jgi:hypothetical protein
MRELANDLVPMLVLVAIAYAVGGWIGTLIIFFLLFGML